MIYGINFGGEPIPEGVKSKFRAEFRTVDMTRGTRWRLVGVGQTAAERDVMLLQASNGVRKLHVEERATAAGVWYGIYTL